jgi:hypothetical protein
MSIKISDTIKDFVAEDFRYPVRGVVCKIVDFCQYQGFSTILKVTPLPNNSDVDSELYKNSLLDEPKNVALITPPGYFGFDVNFKEKYYAYVITHNRSIIEGQPALLVPQSFLFSNKDLEVIDEPDMIDKEYTKELIVSKESLIAGRKYC